MIFSASRSMPSAQRRLISTIALPSGPVPSAKGAQPQVLQNWWRMLRWLKVYSAMSSREPYSSNFSGVVK